MHQTDHVGVSFWRERKSAVKNIIEDLALVLPLEGREAHIHFINDNAERPQICEEARLVAFQHLRRHIEGSAYERSGTSLSLTKE